MNEGGTQGAAEMNPAKGGESHVADRLGLRDAELQRGHPLLVTTSLALRAAEARHLVGLGLLEAEPSRGLCRAADVSDGVAEAMLDAGELAEHRIAADPEPRVVDELQPALDLVARLERGAEITGRDRGSGGEQRVGGLVPWPVQVRVELLAACGQLERPAPLSLM